MFAAEKHFINVIRPQPSSFPFRRSPSHFPSIPFRLLFPFLLPLARYLAFTLSLCFSLRVFLSSHLFSPSLSLSLSLSLSFSLPFFSSFMDLLSVRFCFPPVDLFLFSQRRARSANISSPLLGGFGIGADVFRLNERR